MTSQLRNELVNALKEILFLEDFDEQYDSKLREIQINFEKTMERDPFINVLTFFVKGRNYQREGLISHLQNRFVAARKFYKLARDYYGRAGEKALKSGVAEIPVICEACSNVAAAYTFEKVNTDYFEAAEVLLSDHLSDLSPEEREKEEGISWIYDYSSGLLFLVKGLLSYRKAKEGFDPNTRDELFQEAINYLEQSREIFRKKPFKESIKGQVLSAEIHRFEAERLKFWGLFYTETSRFAKAANNFEEANVSLQKCLTIQKKIGDNLRIPRTQHNVYRLSALTRFHRAQQLLLKLNSNTDKLLRKLSQKEEERIKVENELLFEKIQLLVEESKEDFNNSLDFVSSAPILTTEIISYLAQCDGLLLLSRYFVDKTININTTNLAVDYLLSFSLKIIPKNLDEGINLLHQAKELITEIIFPSMEKYTNNSSIQGVSEIRNRLQIKSHLLDFLIALCEGFQSSSEQKMLHHEEALISIQTLLEMLEANNYEKVRITIPKWEFQLSTKILHSLEHFISARIMMENAKRFHPSGRWLKWKVALEQLIYPLEALSNEIDFLSAEEAKNKEWSNLINFAHQIISYNSSLEEHESQGVTGDFWSKELEKIQDMELFDIQKLPEIANPLIRFLRWLFLKALSYSIVLRAWDAFFKSIRNIQLQKKIAFADIASSLFKFTMDVSLAEGYYHQNQARAILSKGLANLFRAAEENTLDKKRECYSSASQDLENAHRIFSALFNERSILCEVYLHECKALIGFITGLESKERVTKAKYYNQAIEEIQEALIKLEQADKLLRRPVFWYEGMINYLQAIYYTTTLSGQGDQRTIDSQLAILNEKVLQKLQKAESIFSMMEPMKGEIQINEDEIIPMTSLFKETSEEKSLKKLITALKHYFGHYIFQFISYKEKDLEDLLLLENQAIKLQEQALASLAEAKVNFFPFPQDSFRRWIKIGIDYHKILYSIYNWFLTRDQRYKIILADIMNETLEEFEKDIKGLEPESLIVRMEEYSNLFKFFSELIGIINTISPTVERLDSETKVFLTQTKLFELTNLLDNIDDHNQRLKLLWVLTNLEKQFPERVLPKIKMMMLNDDSGINIYSYQVKGEAQLISGFLEAINAFSQEVFEGQPFKTLEVGEGQYLMGTKSRKYKLMTLSTKNTIELRQTLQELVHIVAEKMDEEQIIIEGIVDNEKMNELIVPIIHKKLSRYLD
ncbi:MAG: hypothetical protein GF308_18235 [Candidatus Heimdallarchaeota archaeon]|nr:hypothetical protein [Candidatus Heimdallarchaeota archaeon]